MGWREELQRASLDGIEFKVASSGRSVGRRVAVQKFPGRKEAFVQDLGEDAATFTIEAYAIGDNYKTFRDALEKKLLEPGPKLLIHPYRGTMTVSVIDPPYETRETKDGAGYATITFTVIESGVPETFERTDTALKLDAAAEDVNSKRSAGFGRIFSAQEYDTNKPTGHALNKAISAVAKLNRKVNAQIGIIDGSIARIQLFETELQTLISQPAEVAAGISGIINTALSAVRSISVGTISTVISIFDGDLVRTITEPLLANIETFGDEISDVFGGTATDNIEAANQAQVIRQVQVLSLTELSSLLSTLPFDSFEQASAVRTRIVEAVDGLLIDADDDEYQALLDLSSALSSHLDGVAKSLPEIGSFTPLSTLPSLVIAHRIYGDSTRSDEIIRRNKIKHPGFVPAFKELEILYA
jgi:prophage DNA circulation protein